MKTREEVLEHLLENGYNKKAICKIVGFMIGKELKGEDEVVKIKCGELSFSDFLNWFNKESEDVVCPRCVLCTLCDDIQDMLALAIDMGDEKLIEGEGINLLTYFH